jgi:hypothetical protein
MPQSKICLEAVDPAVAKVLEDWRTSSIDCRNQWHEYAVKIGAVRLFSFPDQKPTSFGFRRNAVPEGWRKVSSRQGGVYMPRKRGRSDSEKAVIEQINADIEALHQPPNFDQMMTGLGLPTQISYTKGENGGQGHNHFAAGFGFQTWQPTWATRKGRILILGPDFEATAQKYIEDGCTVEVNAGNGTIPETFRRLSLEEADFIHAGERLEESKKQQAA